MESTAVTSVSLIQVGVALGFLAVAQLVAVRLVAVEEIPRALQPRVARLNRVRPWVLAVAVALTLAGLGLRLG